MDDIRLLELAGKASGEVYGADRNPLERDDLALRLAVKLRLNIMLDDPDAARAGLTLHQTGAPTSDGRGPWYRKEWNADYEGDNHETTRRAICLAAAEIGKSLQKESAMQALVDQAQELDMGYGKSLQGEEKKGGAA